MSLKIFFKSNKIPGTILKDLNYFLFFMQENRFKVTGNKGLLPRHCLPIINSNMSHPLKLTLKREEQISYPHINALYLLTRALGLIHIEQVKNSRFLTANNEEIVAWNNLSEIDQYFCLMQTWFFNCDERLINRGMRPSYMGVFETIQRFFDLNLKMEQEKGTNAQQELLSLTPLYSIALLEMFGLISITDSEESHNKWTISTIVSKAYANALMGLFRKKKSSNLDFMNLFDEDNEKKANNFYQKISSIIPQWQHCFKPEKKATNQSMHIFKVSLSKDVYRKIRIPGKETLEELASVILHAFKFDEDHLYQFTYTDKFGSLRTIDHYNSFGDIFADEVNIGDLNILIGDSLEFLFDFGDNWLFDVKLEQIDNSTKSKKIAIIESVGKAPKQYGRWG